MERKEETARRWGPTYLVDLEEDSHSEKEGSDSAEEEEANSDSTAAHDSSTQTALPTTPTPCSWAAAPKRHRKNGAAPSCSSRCLWRASLRDAPPPGGHAEVAAEEMRRWRRWRRWTSKKNSVFNPAIEESPSSIARAAKHVRRPAVVRARRRPQMFALGSD